MRLKRLAPLISACVAVASAGSITDVKHVVLYMQENRAFDHYYGTLAGVRGFGDPNVQVNPDGRSTFQQLVPEAFTNGTASLYTNSTPEADRSLTMWHLAYLGGIWKDAMQCSVAGSNSWQANHASLHNGFNNHWSINNTYMSWAYHERNDIPFHFALAESYTICDMYQESVIAATDPNRVQWMSGTINAPGGPTSPDLGGTVIDNNDTPGCDVGPGLGCYPFSWKTVPEYLENAGVSWMVYQDMNNFGDDPLVFFTQYQNAPANSSLAIKGTSYPGLQKFYDDARNGTLPLVSWIVGPAELSEHPPFMPKDGAWLTEQVVNAVTQGKSANDTVLFIMYDETGGWGDHVVPFHSPNGTAGEWMNDPFSNSSYVYTGPGFRVPMHIVSPWTRGGKVFTEHADHTSQIMFLETWLKELGYKDIESQEITSWRRKHMSNFMNAFDWDHPNYSVPVLPKTETPSKNTDGNYNGFSLCMDIFGTDPKPLPPYGQENAHRDMSTLVEEGFKEVSGYLTEGRYLVFEQDGFALSNEEIRLNSTQRSSSGPSLTITAATPSHEGLKQRWIIHQQSGAPVTGGHFNSGTYYLSSAVDHCYLASHLSLDSSIQDAQLYNITFLGSGRGYSLQKENGKYLSVHGSQLHISGEQSGWNVYSVNYHSKSTRRCAA